MFAEHRPEVAGLAAPLHRGLALALALAAAGLREAEAAQQYVRHMLSAVTRELVGLAGEPVPELEGCDLAGFQGFQDLKMRIGPSAVSTPCLTGWLASHPASLAPTVRTQLQGVAT